MSKKGCPFCRGELGALFNADKTLELTLEWAFEGTTAKTAIIAIGRNGKGKETEIRLPIKYCPKCGRNLESEIDTESKNPNIKIKTITVKQFVEGTWREGGNKE